MSDVFSADWAAAWQASINQSRGYHRSGARWNNTVVFVMTGDGAGSRERAVFLDLAGGRCREARAACDDDFESAAFVIATDPETWRRILTGRLDIVIAIMQKRFTLRRGTFADLLPHAPAAHDLLAAARSLETTFDTLEAR